MKRQRTVLGCAILIIAAIAIAGCGDGTSSPTGQAPSQSPSTTRGSTTTTSTASGASTPTEVTIDSSARVGSGVLVEDCPQNQTPGGTSDSLTQSPSPKIFDPAKGTFHQVPAAPIPTGSELQSASCLPTGTSDRPSVTVVQMLHTAPSGLTPEKYETRLVTYTLDSNSEPKTVTLPLPSSRKPGFDLMAGTGGNILWSPDVNSDDDRTTYLTAPDGTQVASYPGREHGSVIYVDEHVFVFSGHVTGGPLQIDGEGPTTQHPGSMIDGKLGKPTSFDPEIANAKASSIVTAATGGFVYSDGKTARYVDTGKKRVTPINTDITLVTVFNNYALPDPIGGLKVLDIANNSVVLQRSREEWDGLRVKHTYLADKYLYLQNTSDSPVIDVTSGKVVSKGWSRRPSETVVKDWTLVLPAEVTNDYARCFDHNPHNAGYPYQISDDGYGCGDTQATLVYSPGNTYPGPWY